MLLLCGGAASAATFSYSISCSVLNIGPDQIQAYTQNGSVTLTPNVPNVSNTVDFFNATTNIGRNNASATFNGTLPCTFTLGGVIVSANRGFQLAVVLTPLVGAALESARRPQGITTGGETHTFTFQAFSFNVVIPGQGTVTVSQGVHTDMIALPPIVPLSAGQLAAIVLTVDPASSSLLFVPLPPVPIPPSIFLTLTGLGAAGWYEVRRRKMAALRG
ncbi:MAG TPA: hypothetical protein VGV35_08740 [Bryobacteraceae bacterium]|nr:hypothetical protein [Bryobacteraceae bacterium]